MKVGMKLAAGFAALILLILALAVVSAVSNKLVTRQVEMLYERGVRGTQALGVASAKLRRVRALAYLHAATPDEQLAAVEQALRQRDEELLSALRDFENIVPAGGSRTAQLELVRNRYRRYTQLREEQVLPLSRGGDTADAIGVMRRVTGPAFEATIDALERLVGEHVAVSARAYNDATATMRDANRITGGLSALAIVLAIFISWLLTRSISSRLREVAKVARSGSRGELSARAEVRGTDEIAEVAAALNQLTGSLSSKIVEEQAAVERQAEERRRLVDTVSRYGAFVRRVARGELSARLESTGDGELRELGENLGAMGEALQNMTLRIHEAVGALSSATAEIMTTVQEHATSANESATAVAETAATVDQVQQSSQRVTEQAQHVADVSRRSAEVSDAGRQAVDHTVTTMSDVREQVDGIAERILSLSEQSQAVGQIITSVNELAEQSNLLALNAAIEAARAGESGRGFAVVAQEIRGLADQSKEATAHVRAMLGDIQKSTTEAVLATEQGSKAVTRGVDAVRGAGERIEQLAATISEASRAADHILTAAQQQALGVNQISQAMHSIDDASRQTVHGTRNVESAARDLNQLAADLRDAVAQYRA